MTDFENFRFRLEASLKTKWLAACEQKRISQQDAINALLAWFLEQESLLQSMILGQIETADWPMIARLVLERMEAGGQPISARRTSASHGGAQTSRSPGFRERAAAKKESGRDAEREKAR